MAHITFLAAWIFSLPILNKRLPIFIFSFGILFLFLALRYDYGNDYFSYYNIHDAMNKGLDNGGFKEILFKILNLLIPNFFILIAFVSLFYLFTIYFLIKSNLKIGQLWMAILVLLINPYLFLIHLSGLRQTLAMCFFVFAVHFAVKRKLGRYLAFVVLAAGFHTSALLMLPVYFFLTESKIKRGGFVFIIGVLVVLLTTPLFDIVLNKALEIYPPYHYYVSLGRTNSVRATLISSIFFFFLLFNLNKMEGKEIIYGKLALLGSIFTLLAYKLSMITRIASYFDIFTIIAIPLILNRLKWRQAKTVLFCVLISIYLVRYVMFFRNPIWSSNYADYHTIFEALSLSQ